MKVSEKKKCESLRKKIRKVKVSEKDKTGESLRKKERKMRVSEKKKKR